MAEMMLIKDAEHLEKLETMVKNQLTNVASTIVSERNINCTLTAYITACVLYKKAPDYYKFNSYKNTQDSLMYLLADLGIRTVDVILLHSYTNRPIDTYNYSQLQAEGIQYLLKGVSNYDLKVPVLLSIVFDVNSTLNHITIGFVSTLVGISDIIFINPMSGDTGYTKLAIFKEENPTALVTIHALTT